jgi:hypothetical protein
MQDGHDNSITEGSSYIVYGANGVIQEMNGFFVPPAPAAA